MKDENRNTTRGNTWDRQMDDDGEFVRKPTTFRSRISADGSTEFAPDTGRYHLYVLADPLVSSD